MLYLLLLVLWSPTGGGTATAADTIQTPPLVRRFPRRDAPILRRQKSSGVPVFVGSGSPLVEKQFVSIVRESGPQTPSEPVRELLLPVWPNISPPSVPGVTVRTSCEGNKMQLQVERSIMGPEDPDPPLRLGTCQPSKSTEEYLYFDYDLGMCGTKHTVIGNRVIYFNMLHYNPPKPRGPIRRALPFSLPVACYANRYVFSYKVGFTPKVQIHKVFEEMKNNVVLTPRNDNEPGGLELKIVDFDADAVLRKQRLLPLILHHLPVPDGSEPHLDRCRASSSRRRDQLLLLKRPLPTVGSNYQSDEQAWWDKLPPSDHYAPWEPMYFEVEAPSLSRYERLYVHACFVSPGKSPTSAPQFPVLKNFGCAVENEAARSRFIPYRNDAVRFSVEVFFLEGMEGQPLYMHCSVSVGSLVPTPTAKSCNYDTKAEKWVELFGSESVCDCCDSICDYAAPPATQIVSSGPWTVESRMKPATPLKRKAVSGTPAAAPEMKGGRWGPRGGAETLVGEAGQVRETEWPFGGVGVTWVEEEGEDKQVKGSAVAEAEEDGVGGPRRIFEDIFVFHK